MEQDKIALSLLAHPDDAEFMCAGTMAMLHQKGWKIHIATMTPGDCGSVEYNREQISQIRKAEAAKSAALLDGSYHCLECDDVFVMYDRPTLLKAIKLLREVRPALVFAPSPSDYMIDHEMTSRVVQMACFACGIPNVETPGVETFDSVPHLYYVDPTGGKDILGNKIWPSVLVDISSVMDTKEKMLCCHGSQRNWLRAHHGVDEYVISMKNFTQERAELIGCDYAEGFRQHLGHAYPDDNILKSELKGKVYIR
jgi:LmbE family N-acetylglucosaminyl deacetylase